jgi:tRNA pseudouridine38-40 synthase
MKKTRYYYILSIQYLGFRYHGWQHQPNVPTVEQMFRKTLSFALSDPNAKVMSSGRTDAKVSAQQTVIELFTYTQIKNLEVLIGVLNYNLPADIRILSAKETNKDFNIIQSKKTKTYHYYFAFGEKFHPFCSALMCHLYGKLDIPLMQKAAKLFVGTKDFYSYTFQPKEETITKSTIDECSIVENKNMTASFFPEKTYVLIVKGAGFKRNQIRLMMGALIDLGRHTMSWDYFLSTLKGENKLKLEHKAPASGLILHSVVLQ